MADPVDLDAVRRLYVETEDSVDWACDPWDALTWLPVLVDEVERLRAELAALNDGPDEHVIDLRDDGWTIKHPLSCRPHLFDCPVNRAAERDLTAAPAQLGRFVCLLDEVGGFTIDTTPDGAR